MVAIQTRRHYEDLEDGYEQYEAFMQQNRTKIAALLNRMVAGRTFGDLIRTTLDDGTIQCRLRAVCRDSSSSARSSSFPKDGS